MNAEYILVFLIIAAAAFYVGRIVWRQAKSAVKTSDCGTNCGCGDSKTNQRVSAPQK